MACGRRGRVQGPYLKVNDISFFVGSNLKGQVRGKGEGERRE